ncbi:type VI secretion system baseplate subunit TssG [Herbaspirillum sp. GCM10030257]|uniref:type VI secretion system baseplate subunit TssG n=1 Tax=Herbaspirillum sp. GCM10030257 TaxID=3273393 RepID=UPI00360D1EEC
MPGTQRRFHPRLIEQLVQSPHRFEFFQAVRLLLAYQKRFPASHTDDLLGQTIRFRNSVSLGFPPSEIEAMEIEWETAEESGIDVADVEGSTVNAIGEPRFQTFRRVTITPAFIGLTGPLGVLPRHYTQHVAEREIYHRDTATRSFLDIFTSRAVTLFYQSWLKYRLHLQYEADRRSRFLPLILSLSGLRQHQSTAKQEADGIADESFAYYVAALRERPRSPQWCARVIADYFQTKANIEQFSGQWLALPLREQTQLGVANSVLGDSGFCGNRIWVRDTAIRLELGPLRRREFDELLPGNAGARKLTQLLRVLLGITFESEVHLTLDARDIFPIQLSAAADSQLGWSSWMTPCVRHMDARDTTYRITHDA